MLAVEDIYQSVLSAVMHNGAVSKYFECPSGLKQGCLLCRIFSIFMTEIFRALNVGGGSLTVLNFHLI